MVRADGSRLPVPSNGSAHSNEYYWIGQVDGTWKIEITNTGTSPVTPEYGLTYSTQADQLGLSSSLYAPELWMRVSQAIGGIPRSDLTLQSELIGPDGSRCAQAFTYNAVTYTGLPSGDYFARVWTVVNGVTYQESGTVGVHVAETDPPSVVIGTSPTTPNAAGWFRSVSEDNAGNRSEGRDLHLYVDATAPWINLVSPDEDELSILPNGHFAQNERVVTYTVDAAPAPNGNGGVVGPNTPRLASTGADGLAGGVALAVLLLGAGAALAARRRLRTR